MNIENLGWNPNRVLFGLSRIGYTPDSAIADIIDNSVTNNATNVYIKIVKDREDLADSRRNNIKEYLIIDDGAGMNKQGILTAFDLGSDQLLYNDDSLSKFGLGLKSASFSQGNILDVISSSEQNSFLKYVVDLNKINDTYFCTNEELSENDKNLIKKYIPNGIGTIIRVSDIHTNNHPSPKKSIEQLLYKLGVIYYYFINDGVNIFLNGNKIEKYDVLFSDEAERNGNLNEHEWNGKTVCWIKKPTSQTLDIDSKPAVKAIVEVTQLPHPPIHDLDGEGERAKVRKKYKIESGNYGYYVYRNKRLISWAEKFDGLIPQDQDFFSFRGRILLDSTADDPFNIDVKKSHLKLSDEAYDALSDLSDEYKRKSKKAWLRANELKKQMLGEEPNGVSNDIAEYLDIPEILSGEAIPTPEEEISKQKREKEIKKRIKEKIRDEAKEQKEDDNLTDKQVEEYASGGAENKSKRIFRVPYIQDNLLFEPYYDDDHGWSVRINKTHRFSKCIFEDNSDNMDMQVLFELFFLQLSHAEIAMRKQTSLNQDAVEEIVLSYRELLSNLLVTMMRSQDVRLPPLK